MIDKNKVTKFCIDDFAIKKRQRYGTIMVDIETHKIIDLIPSRDLEDVLAWLKNFPNLKLFLGMALLLFATLLPKLIQLLFKLVIDFI